MSETETNKALAMRWMEASVRGDAAAARALFAPDCRCLVVGDMPYCGWMDVDAFFAQTQILKLAGPITLEVGAVLAEGDRVWFEAQSEARLASGEDYRNFYIFQMRFAGGRIAEYKEFTDTLHIWRKIDDPQVRGPAAARQPFLTEVSRRLIGNALAGAGE